MKEPKRGLDQVELFLSEIKQLIPADEMEYFSYLSGGITDEYKYLLERLKHSENQRFSNNRR